MGSADALDLFLSAVMVSAPAFGWVLLGLFMARIGVLPRALNDRISLLSFRYGLPLMLFAGAAQVDYTQLSQARYVLAGVLSTFVALAVGYGYCRWRGFSRSVQGVVTQAAFRSNLAIIGMALAVSAYGERATGLAALPIALMTMLYNVLAVWVLDSSHGAYTEWRRIAMGVARNPLILGISAGILYSLSGVNQPEQLPAVGKALSTFFLPVVLACIGGAMNLSQLYQAGSVCWEASVLRLCVSPLLAVLLALAMGVQGEALGVLFLLVATPVAASSYIMVVAVRGDGVLAANLVVLTTCLSVLTITLGFFLLSLFGLVGELA